MNINEAKLGQYHKLESKYEVILKQLNHTKSMDFFTAISFLHSLNWHAQLMSNNYTWDRSNQIKTKHLSFAFVWKASLWVRRKIKLRDYYWKKP